MYHVCSSPFVEADTPCADAPLAGQSRFGAEYDCGVHGSPFGYAGAQAKEERESQGKKIVPGATQVTGTAYVSLDNGSAPVVYGNPSQHVEGPTRGKVATAARREQRLSQVGNYVSRT